MRDELIVDVPVPHAVSKRVDARAKEPLRILEGKEVGRDAELVLVGLVDDRAIQGRSQLLELAVPVVHPDLDEIDLPRGQLLYGLSGLRFAGNPIRGLRPPRLRHRDPASRGAKSRGAGDGLLPHLERHIARILAEAHDRADPVVRLPLQLIDERLARHRHVRMRVDDRRHDGLAGQIHASRTRRHLQLPSRADLGEPVVLDDERGILDGRAAVPDDEPRPFEHRHAGRLRCLARTRG